MTLVCISDEGKSVLDEQLYLNIKENDRLQVEVRALINDKSETEESKRTLLDELDVSHQRMKDLQGVVGLYKKSNT